MSKVLHMRIGDAFVFFDDKQNASCVLQAFNDKNIIVFNIADVTENVSVLPSIHLFVGLLKRSSFEQVIYYAAQLGARSIQPILTERVHKHWWSDREVQRLRSVMVGAREQSKSFCEPELKKPCALQDLLFSISRYDLVFETHEPRSLVDGLNGFGTKKSSEIGLFFGPEGGFADNEITFLKKQNMCCCKLTSTILRTQEAVLVGAGFVLSVLS